MTALRVAEAARPSVFGTATLPRITFKARRFGIFSRLIEFRQVRLSSDTLGLFDDCTKDVNRMAGYLSTGLLDCQAGQPLALEKGRRRMLLLPTGKSSLARLWGT